MVKMKLQTSPIFVFCIFLHVCHGGRVKRSWCAMMETDQGWFRCKNNQNPWCIHPALKCDHKNECSDGSDESAETCEDNGPPAVHRGMESYCPGCSDFEKKWLDFHNELRRSEDAANMNELQWDQETANQASAWAKECRFRKWGEAVHGHMDPNFGQNVARFVGTEYRPPDYVVINAIQMWFDERALYDFDSDDCSGICGHYKTVMNAYSRDFGCGFELCHRSRDVEGTTESVVFWNLVCDYRPWPNWQVSYTHPPQPYKKGPACTKCQPGLECRQDLCS